MEIGKLVHHVKDALTNFYDPTHLQTHPLASLLDLKRGPGELAGESLRRALRAAMEALRPPPSVAPTQSEWLGYRILQMRYIQSCDVGAIRRELGLSEATYYRHQRQAIEALASVLEGNARPAPSAGVGGPTDELAPAPSQAADEVHEATRLAREAPRPPVRLQQMLDEAVTTFLPLAQQRGISLEIDAPADLPTACVDPAMFHQILLNVLMEGLRHASGSALRVVLRQTSDAETLWGIEGLQSGRWVRESLKAAQGFTISQSLLDVYGGRIWYEESRSNRGTLCFTLPCAPPGWVLIIDDDTDTVTLYRRYLEALDCRVESVANADQIMDSLAGGVPDVILLDVLMPQQDGWKTLQRLKTMPETAHVPVIICSVLSQPSLALALGAAEVLHKPISRETLLDAVRRVLASKDSAAAAHPRAPSGTGSPAPSPADADVAR